MVKKILMLGIVAIMLFSLAGCGYPVDKFDSLEEMQEALSDNFASFEDFQYFDFEQEGVKETGKFEATKGSKGGKYFRYSIWYDVEYTINGQKQERKLRVVASENRYPMSSIGTNTEAFRLIINQIFDSWHDTIDIVGFSLSGVAFDENKKSLSLSASSSYYFYYFILEGGVQASFIEQELESFLSICKLAIENKYKIT